MWACSRCFLLVNNTSLVLYTKRQRTVEASTYGLELVAARIETEKVIKVRYKLKILGRSLERTSFMVGDNINAILNTTNPSSMLKKKHNAVVCYRVRETIASMDMHFCHLPSTANIADVLTKLLKSKILHGLLRQYLYR